MLLAALCFAAHILATARAVDRYEIGALLVESQLAVCGAVCLVIAAAAGRLEAPLECHRVVRARRDLAGGKCARILRPDVRPAPRAAGPPRADPGLEPAFAGLFGWLLADERLSAAGWLGAALIMAAILAVEVVRLRPRARCHRRAEPRHAQAMSSTSTMKMSVSLGPIAGGDPCAP